jgi:hypothetical protein
MRTVALALAILSVPAAAQEAGWHYSPLAGEGDRAALGCAHDSTSTDYTCLVVRCEDDFAIGVHIHTSRAGGDAGRWKIEVDRGQPRLQVEAAPDGSPYGARVAGDVTPIVEGLKHGAVAYIEPLEGPPVTQGIPLSGSFYVINQALYFCAPKAPTTGEEPASD